jgi:thioredoxin-dependent peroxiredoxin
MAAKKATRVATVPKLGTLNVGEPLPRFELHDQEGKLVASESFLGKRLVLYFYPKDDTPGCTREACGFQKVLTQLKKVKAQVVGVSADSVERHQRFADKYHLTFPLLVDTDRSLANACGVIGEKVLYGKRSIGVIRSTFIVDEQGIVRKVFRKVKVDGHVDEVLTALRELGKP